MNYNYLYYSTSNNSRSPSAFRALRDLGILKLPCDATVKGYMDQRKLCVNESAIVASAQKYETHIEERVQSGHKCPLKEGILIWDETKVSIIVY